MTVTRRSFLGSAAAACACRSWAARPEGRIKLREFAYPQVKLTGGPLAAMYHRMHAHFLKLDEDRLLKVYRQRAGMPAPGRDMGGWYDADGFVPGHLLGPVHFGAVADPRRHGRRARRRRKRAGWWTGYAATFERDGNPYASPKARPPGPCYILDKYEIGLIDAATLAGIEPARTLLPRVIEARQARCIPDHVFDRVRRATQPPYDEPYILPENLFKSARTHRASAFLDLAQAYLLDDGFFDPLANGRNVLPGKHGYSHMIALSSAREGIRGTGRRRNICARSATRGTCSNRRSSSLRARGLRKEMFVQPARSGELGESLTSTRDHFETPCCFYAYAKLARYLHGVHGRCALRRRAGAGRC